MASFFWYIGAIVSKRNRKGENMLLQNIIDIFSEETDRAYFVGGYVRDSTVGLEPKDADIVVFDVSIERMAEIAREFGWKSAGESFPVYIAKTSDWGEVEIALPRKEKSTGNGYTDFEVFCDPYLSVEDDAKRRDFTCNSMGENIFTGEILDPFGGKNDIDSGILVPVANFADDPVRVFRALRFALRFGWRFSDELSDTMCAMEKSEQTPERIGKELTKIAEQWNPDISDEFVIKIFTEMYLTGWLEYFLPDVALLYEMPHIPNKYHFEDTFSHTLMVTNRAMKTMGNVSPIVRLMCGLFHDVGKYHTIELHKSGERYSYIMHERFSASIVKNLIETGIPKSEVMLARKIIFNHMLPHKFLSQKALFNLWQEMGANIHHLFDFAICDEEGRIADEGRGISHIESMREIIAAWERFPKTTGKDLVGKFGTPSPKDGKKFGEKLVNFQRKEFYALYQSMR